MTEEPTGQEDGTFVRCPPYFSTEPSEFIAFDLVPVREAHPEHAAIIDLLSRSANPPLTWGILSTAEWLQKDFSDTTVEEQHAAGLWSFIGQTCEERDQEGMERFREELLDYARGYSASEEFLQIMRDLKTAYYEVTYHDTGPATKVLKPAAQ